MKFILVKQQVELKNLMCDKGLLFPISLLMNG